MKVTYNEKEKSIEIEIEDRAKIEYYAINSLLSINILVSAVNSY